MKTLAVLVACLLSAGCLSSCVSRPAKTTSQPVRQDAAPVVYSPDPGASLCLSLALPRQGPARSIAEKIARGANAAKRELERQGTMVTLHMLDADQPDWLDQLAALPPECALVGGPMQAAAYSAAKNSPAARGRAFFTFMPQLEPDDEGRIAWRFFPSPEDQVDALLGFLQIEMGFSAYAALYPDEPYGRRMTEIFRQRAALRGAAVQAARYTPGATAEWANAAAKLVGRQEINKTPFPTTNFQAIFLPGSWASADQLITSLHYNGEDRLVLLGDALWGEGIQNRPPGIPRYYQIALFPGAWNPTLAGPGAQSLLAAAQGAAPDFWLGLGYDFLRFAARLNLPAGWTPQLVAQHAAQAQRSFAWSIAPISWDEQGKATQALFVFTPVAGTFAPVQPEQFKASWREAQARFADRVRTAQSGSAAKGLSAPRPPVAPAAP